jgi:hypothetical protein
MLRDEVASLRAEMATLRRTPPNEIANLRDEMATLRRMTPTKEVVQESIYSHLRADGELDMRFRSSKQDLSVVQQEVAELKGLVNQILMTMSSCPRTAADMGGYSTDENQLRQTEKQKEYWRQNYYAVGGKGGALLRSATE